MAYHSWQTPYGRGGHRETLKYNEVLLQMLETEKSATYRIRMNPSVGRTVVGKNLTKLDIMEDDLTGEIALVFNKEMGIELKRKGNYIAVNSKDWVSRLYDHLQLEGTRVTLLITNNLSRDEDKCVYRIIKKCV